MATGGKVSVLCDSDCDKSMCGCGVRFVLTYLMDSMVVYLSSGFKKDECIEIMIGVIWVSCWHLGKFSNSSEGLEELNIPIFEVQVLTAEDADRGWRPRGRCGRCRREIVCLTFLRFMNEGLLCADDLDNLWEIREYSILLTTARAERVQVLLMNRIQSLQWKVFRFSILHASHLTIRSPNPHESSAIQIITQRAIFLRGIDQSLNTGSVLKVGYVFYSWIEIHRTSALGERFTLTVRPFASSSSSSSSSSTFTLNVDNDTTLRLSFFLPVTSQFGSTFVRKHPGQNSCWDDSDKQED
ncbi:uncharacterized protein BDR25DRAFT_362525 [Lindgomyces ingoldianus]|uniref:Uncharacterized protein n=1 Tax=Lindgomyces ingoldianus TaxID=673940 RepID=A0ACB6Q9U4_9PLEO|nr:uncharacterized protein BDR25DRAFT_362525 [Lindgomyces ingoldianus]KAF2463723.1 hypothetical protein BDR25DRAFT_362525 [Lindgomyces ingoldianus]